VAVMSEEAGCTLLIVNGASLASLPMLVAEDVGWAGRGVWLASSDSLWEAACSGWTVAAV